MTEVDVFAAPSAAVPDASAEPAAPAPAPPSELLAPPADSAASPPKKVDGRVRRINELTYQLRQEQREKDRLMDLVQSTLNRPAQTQPGSPPKLSDFPTFDAYLDARDEWRDKQRDTRASKIEPKATQPTGPSEEFLSQRDALLEAGSEKYEDFADKISDRNLKISDAMASFIIDSDNSVDLGYFLASNPKESARIAALTPLRQVAELTRLEDKLLKAPKRTSTTPAPVAPVSGTAPVESGPSASDDIGAWIRKRQKQVHGGK